MYCQFMFLVPCPCPCCFNLNMVLWIFKADMAIILSIPKDPTGWHRNLKGLSYERMVKIQLTISAPLPVREIYRMIPLSAKQISLTVPLSIFWMPSVTDATFWLGPVQTNVKGLFFSIRGPQQISASKSTGAWRQRPLRYYKNICLRVYLGKTTQYLGKLEP